MAKSAKRSSTATDIRAALGNLTPKLGAGQEPTHEQIAHRAYQRWEHAGCQPGMAELDWIRAEEELMGTEPRDTKNGASSHAQRKECL